MREKPRPQEIYRHFKGNIYQVISIAFDSETGEEMVVYQALYGDYRWYVRPLAMFMSEVDHKKYPDSSQQYRFEILKEAKKVLEQPGERQGENLKVNQEEKQAQKPEENKGKSQEEKQAQKPEEKKEEDQMKIAAIGKPIPSKETDAEQGLDPLVLDFLDANSYEEKLNILTALHHRITNEMINTMAIASDLEIGEMDLEDRYQELRYCLTTKSQFEVKRY